MKLSNAFKLKTLGGVAALVLGIVLAVPVGAAPHRTVANGLITAPGVYDASIVYIPGISVPGGLPDCVNDVAQQIYVGQITVTKTATGSTVSFDGTNVDNPKFSVQASADFSESWSGFALGPLGGRDDAVVAIDHASIISGSVRGKVTGSNGRMGILMATVGLAGVFEKCDLKGPAAH
jgi:hypothetical protein